MRIDELNNQIIEGITNSLYFKTRRNFMLTEKMFTQALRETQEQMGTTEWEWPEVRMIDELGFMKKRKVLKNS